MEDDEEEEEEEKQRCVITSNGKNDDDASSSVGEQSVLHDAKQSSYDAVNDPPTYSATEREAMQPTSLVYERLSPAWRVLLLSDGSVTRHLSLLGKRGHTHRALGEVRGEDAAAEVNEDDVTEEDSNSTNGENTKVEVIRMKPCSRDPSQPEDVVKIKGPLMQREVYLRYDEEVVVGRRRRRVSARLRVLVVERERFGQVHEKERRNYVV